VRREALFNNAITLSHLLTLPITLPKKNATPPGV
jgi:hypothetical protein